MAKRTEKRTWIITKVIEAKTIEEALKKESKARIYSVTQAIKKKGEALADAIGFHQEEPDEGE